MSLQTIKKKTVVCSSLFLTGVRQWIHSSKESHSSPCSLPGHTHLWLCFARKIWEVLMASETCSFFAVSSSFRAWKKNVKKKESSLMQL